MRDISFQNNGYFHSGIFRIWSVFIHVTCPRVIFPFGINGLFHFGIFRFWGALIFHVTYFSFLSTSTTTQQHNNTTTQQHNNTTTQQHNNTTTQQHNLFIHVHNNTTTQQHNNTTTQQHNNTTVSVRECVRPPANNVGGVMYYLAS